MSFLNIIFKEEKAFIKLVAEVFIELICKNHMDGILRNREAQAGYTDLCNCSNNTRKKKKVAAENNRLE